ncbi:MAG: hypothetical protein A2V99_11230 [Spirochaetes bacterium RBG_16_67_19]|nr:MAG: hypothetical protein A2V99_11230 [Spirochaetes bacterium RBG_16_67_19]
MHHFPDAGGNVAVDFLLARGGRYVAIEAKSSPKLQDAHLKGLRAIAPLPGLHRRLVVYAGSPSERSRRTEDGIDVWPVPVFLKHLQDSSFWY